MKTKSIITRKDTMIHLEQFHLACELLRLIKHFFPELMSLLKKIKDPRHQSYITYEKEILLMTKILSSIFYIESMRKQVKNLIAGKQLKMSIQYVEMILWSNCPIGAR